jgi:allantoinase
LRPDRIVRSHRVVTPGGVAPASIHIAGGVIQAVYDFDDAPAGVPLDDFAERAILPGLVDTHVHINEPGRTEWEGFETATRAAAAGGVTTLVEMPLNSIPATTTAAACQEKIAAARGKCHVDVGFWGGVIPGNAGQLRPLWEAGVFGFKCFLVPSGVAEFPHVSDADLRVALPELKRLGATLLVHAESPGPIDHATAAARQLDPVTHAAWLASRPREAETQAIAWMIGLAVEFGVRVHIVHLSSSDALLMLRWARSDGLPVTVETCPHYLLLASEEISDRATEFKCAPPIREADNRLRLWAGLEDRLIDCVVSDHSPCPPEMKCQPAGDFFRAWGGIASLQLSLPALWTAARERGHSVARIAQWMSSSPARLAGLDAPERSGGRKGSIAEGFDADLVVWDPDASFTVAPENLHHRHKVTPYAGRRLDGVVEVTYLRGEIIYDRGRFPVAAAGKILKRT